MRRGDGVIGEEAGLAGQPWICDQLLRESADAPEKSAGERAGPDPSSVAPVAGLTHLLASVQSLGPAAPAPTPPTGRPLLGRSGRARPPGMVNEMLLGLTLYITQW